jgi:hypothetical protein
MMDLLQPDYKRRCVGALCNQCYCDNTKCERHYACNDPENDAPAMCYCKEREVKAASPNHAGWAFEGGQFAVESEVTNDGLVLKRRK